MSALLPALLVALFALWSGTFHGGASWSGALAGDLALIGFALAAPRLGDPLRLGRGALVLPWAFAVALAASAAASEVPRAGLEAVAAFPALLLLPAAVEGAWRDPRRRRDGCRALAMVTLVVATWALVDAAASGSWRAAAPLGHHGALAVWLLFVLPFATLLWLERGPWRAVGVAATAAAVAALLLTRSLVGAALLVVQAAILLRDRRARVLALALAAALALTLQGPRLIAIASGSDPSIAARGAYFAAGTTGIRARPALGSGPGSVGWTIGEHLRPVPGRNPPGEVVSYLHFLPLDLAYQLGIAATLLAVAVVAAFVIGRRGARATAVDPPLLYTSMAALGPGLAALCLAGFQPLAATVVAAGVAGGAALAATSVSAVTDRSFRAARAVILLYTACALGVLVPLRLAQRLYDQARVDPHPFTRLAGATHLDGGFPLYVARRAWTSGLDRPEEPRAAGEALRAAERAPGVAALWLAAGLLGSDSVEPWAEAALRRACDLDPLSAMAPYRLALLDPAPRDADLAAARALLAEPRLAAATDWHDHGALYARALGRIATWRGVDERWRAGVVARLRSLPPVSGRRTRPFSLELDGEAQTSLSLFVFRRLPWPTTLSSVDLDTDRLRRVAQLGSAALRTDTEPWAFAKNECGGAEPP